MRSGKGCLPHTGQSLGHTFPALCRVQVGLNDVVLSLRPSDVNLLDYELPPYVDLQLWVGLNHVSPLKI